MGTTAMGSSDAQCRLRWVSDTVDYQLASLLRPHGNYYRFQPNLGQEGCALDDTRRETTRLLRAAGENTVVNQQEDFHAICQKLLE